MMSILSLAKNCVWSMMLSFDLQCHYIWVYFCLQTPTAMKNTNPNDHKIILVLHVCLPQSKSNIQTSFLFISAMYNINLIYPSLLGLSSNHTLCYAMISFSYLTILLCLYSVSAKSWSVLSSHVLHPVLPNIPLIFFSTLLYLSYPFLPPY